MEQFYPGLGILLVYSLSLDNNKIWGSLPRQLRNLVSLNVLYLQKNNFSGLIPSSIKKCEIFYDLRLSYNSLTGSIPVEIGKIGNLQVMLDLSGNFLSGSIPSSLVDLMMLKVLSISPIINLAVKFLMRLGILEAWLS